MSGLEHFNGIQFAVLVAAIVLTCLLPYFLQKDQDAYHMQHTAESGCPDCADKP